MDATALRLYIVPAIVLWVSISGKTMVFGQGLYCPLVDDLSEVKGNTELFEVTLGGVRLRDSLAGEAALWSEVKSGSLEVIELEAFLAFSPSTSNFIQLRGITGVDSFGQESGWLIHLGASGSMDKVEINTLVKGSKDELIGEGKYVYGGTENTRVSWRIEISDTRLTLFTRERKGLRWREEVSVKLPTSALPFKTGIFLHYTRTRSDKFWINRWCYSSRTLGPPEVECWSSDVPGKCKIYFGEPVSLTQDFFLYLLPDLDSPIDLKTDSLEFGLLEAEWDDEFFSIEEGPLVLKGIMDSSGLISDVDTVDIIWHLPERAESHIVISEIMADPEPSRGWPKSEFIELTNFGPDAMSAYGWQIHDTKSSGLIDSFTILPESSLLMVPLDWIHEWQRIGIEACAVDPWPSLNNGEDVICIYNGLGEKIDCVEYDLSKAEPVDKSGGGWSLTRSADPCFRDASWSFNMDDSGCTPGRWSPAESYSCPIIPFRTEINDELLDIRFSLGPVSIPGVEEIRSNKGLSIDQIYYGDDQSNWEIDFRENLIPGEHYQLFFDRTLFDSCSNVLLQQGKGMSFGLPVEPDSSMIIINEILLTGDDKPAFIELYNNSEKVFNIDHLIINFPMQGEWVALEDSYLLYPGSYVALTSRPCLAFQSFQCPDSAEIVFQEKMDNIRSPDSLIIELIYVSGSQWTMLDRIIYRESWHPASLDDKDDRSLSRVDPGQSGLLQGNWVSSLPPGPGGTPGRFNLISTNSAEDKMQASMSGFISPSGPEYLWTLDWDLGDGDWEMMVELFSFDGRYLGMIKAPGPVITAGRLQWSYSDVSDFVKWPGAYLFSITFWSKDGQSKRFTDHAVSIH